MNIWISARKERQRTKGLAGLATSKRRPARFRFWALVGTFPNHKQLCHQNYHQITQNIQVHDLFQVGYHQIAAVTKVGKITKSLHQSMGWQKREHLQETIDFSMKYMGFSCNFPLKPINWNNMKQSSKITQNHQPVGVCWSDWWHWWPSPPQPSPEIQSSGPRPGRVHGATNMRQYMVIFNWLL